MKFHGIFSIDLLYETFFMFDYLNFKSINGEYFLFYFLYVINVQNYQDVFIFFKDLHAKDQEYLIHRNLQKFGNYHKE